MELIEEVLRTTTIAASDASDHLPDNAMILLADSPPDHRGGAAAWARLERESPDRVCRISPPSNEVIAVRIGHETLNVQLRDCSELFGRLAGRDIFLDISGLTFDVWGPIVKFGLRSGGGFNVAYAEPVSYRWHDTPTSTTFDLSERIIGIRPLPGFAKLSPRPDGANALLVVLLGFEGGRAKHIASQFDPLPSTIPIIGVPGFRHDFPQHALTLNISFLDQTDSHGTLRMAAANSPFETSALVAEIVQTHKPEYTLVAPIGTKPHALGALLYCLKNWDTTEIVYDNPIPRKGRSDGIARVHLYRLTP